MCMKVKDRVKLTIDLKEIFSNGSCCIQISFIYVIKYPGGDSSLYYCQGLINNQKLQKKFDFSIKKNSFYSGAIVTS